MEKRMYWTGVGSRKTPADILKVMEDLGKYMVGKGYILRSGGAEGADKAFEKFVPYDCKDIYYAKDSTPEAEAIAAKYHAAWERCSGYARSLHGRNAFQVLGRDLNTPSRFMVCWTPDRCLNHKWRSIKTGGTGTAISIADAYGVRIFNLARTDHLEHVKTKIYKNYLSPIIQDEEVYKSEEQINSEDYLWK